MLPVWHAKVAALWEQDIDDTRPAPRAYDTVPCDAWQPSLEELVRHFRPFGDARPLSPPDARPLSPAPDTVRAPTAPTFEHDYLRGRPLHHPFPRRPQLASSASGSSERGSSVSSRSSFAFSDRDTASSASSCDEREPSPLPKR